MNLLFLAEATQLGLAIGQLDAQVVHTLLGSILFVPLSAHRTKEVLKVEERRGKNGVGGG